MTHRLDCSTLLLLLFVKLAAALFLLSLHFLILYPYELATALSWTFYSSLCPVYLSKSLSHFPQNTMTESRTRSFLAASIRRLSFRAFERYMGRRTDSIDLFVSCWVEFGNHHMCNFMIGKSRLPSWMLFVTWPSSLATRRDCTNRQFTRSEDMIHDLTECCSPSSARTAVPNRTLGAKL